MFLDRDGTIIHDVGYPRDPELVRLLPGVGRALARLKDLGFLLVLISTQSGVGRGLITREEVQRVHDRMVELLEEEGVALDESKYCLHAPWDGCSCRKPSPQMIEEAAKALDIRLPESFMVGDKPTDVETGRNAGCRTVLMRDVEAVTDVSGADFVTSNWEEALGYIESVSNSG